MLHVRLNKTAQNHEEKGMDGARSGHNTEMFPCYGSVSFHQRWLPGMTRPKDKAGANKLCQSSNQKAPRTQGHLPKHYTKDKNKRVRLTVDPDDVALDELHAAHPAELAAEVDLQAEEVAVVELPAGAGGACVLPGVCLLYTSPSPRD